MDANASLPLAPPMICFNPRARDGRELVFFIIKTSIVCFNPRARDGREYYCDGGYLLIGVSIHAPVMDAKSSMSA